MGKVILLRSLFNGRTDAYGLYDFASKQCRSVKEALTDQVINDHLAGKKLIGVYPILPGSNTVNFTAIDLDEDNLSKAIEIINKLAHFKIPAYLERSKSKGYHVWFFFSSPVPALKVTTVAKFALEELGITAEIFPKQAKVEDGGYGNYINLPLNGRFVSEGKTVFLDAHNGAEQVKDQWAFLERIEKIEERLLDEIIELNELNKPQPREVTTQKTETYAGYKNLPCYIKILKGVEEGHRDNAAFCLAVQMKRAGCNQEELLSCLEKWDERNKPPLGEDIIAEKVESVFKQEYAGLGCDKLAPFCDEACPVKRKGQIQADSRPVEIHLMDIEKDAYLDKLVSVPVRVDGIGETYFVPSAFKVWCNNAECGKPCHYYGEGKVITLKKGSPHLIKLTAQSLTQQIGTLREAANSPSCNVKIEVCQRASLQTCLVHCQSSC